jgi:hypothetical protein
MAKLKVKKKKDWMEITVGSKKVIIWRDAGNNVVVEVEHNKKVIHEKLFLMDDIDEEE